MMKYWKFHLTMESKARPSTTNSTQHCTRDHYSLGQYGKKEIKGIMIGKKQLKLSRTNK